VGPRAGLDVLDKKKNLLPLSGLEPRNVVPVAQPVGLYPGFK